MEMFNIQVYVSLCNPALRIVHFIDRIQNPSTVNMVKSLNTTTGKVHSN